MRFLIVDYCYQTFLESFYVLHPDQEQLSYEDALQTFLDASADVAGAYSSNLRALGHEVEVVIVNDEILQRRWAVENGIRNYDARQFSDASHSLKRMGRRILTLTGHKGRKMFGWVRRPMRKFADPWMYEILGAQIERSRPDVLLSFTVGEFDDAFFRQTKPFVKLTVGQHASPLPKNVSYSSFDLMLSSLPNQVDFFRRKRVRSEYFRLGFDATVSSRLQRIPNAPAVVHVGSYDSVHNERNRLLEDVARKVPVHFWGFGVENLSKKSPILQSYVGEAWGMDRNNILHSSKIALTKHITSVAGRYANNQTLYEATGVGTLLVTDMKDNLNDLFEVGEEVVAYRDSQECAELLKYYLEHENERAAIAEAGQQRTLREHTYYHRMQELVEIVKRYLS